MIRALVIVVVFVILTAIAYMTASGGFGAESADADGYTVVRTFATLCNDRATDALVWEMYSCEPSRGVLAPGESIQLVCGESYAVMRYVPLPVASQPAAGSRFDFDGDGDVDLADLMEFQACFNGPNRAPRC